MSIDCKECKSFNNHGYCEELDEHFNGYEVTEGSCEFFEFKKQYLGKAYEELDVQPGDEVLIHGCGKKYVVSDIKSSNSYYEPDRFVYIKRVNSIGGGWYPSSLFKVEKPLGKDYIKDDVKPGDIVDIKKVEGEVKMEKEDHKVNKEKLISYLMGVEVSTWGRKEEDGIITFYITGKVYADVSYDTQSSFNEYSMEISNMKLKITDVPIFEIKKLFDHILIEKEELCEKNRINTINESIDMLVGENDV